MEYLLVMALSGSTMAIVYFFLRRLMWNKISARTFYLMAKAAVLYYLVPLPFLKTWYLDIIPTVVLEHRMETDRIPLIFTKHTVLASGDLHVNRYAVIQMAIAVVWLIGGCVRLTRRLRGYLRINRQLAGYAEMRMTDRDRSFVDSLRAEYGVRRLVSLVRVQDGEATFTFGIHRPLIICGRATQSREAELLIRHEMIHIRRLDVPWEILVEFVTLLHWWNPFMRNLAKDFKKVCECSCDEAVVSGKTDDEVKEYVRLLIDEARERKPESVSVRWKSAFGSDENDVRERMGNLMKKNKWNRYAAGALTAVLIFANSMTVFAYRDGFSEVLPEDVSQEEISSIFDKDVSVFSIGDMNGDATSDYEMEEVTEILYDSQFTDEEGNVYPAWEEDGATTYCNHSYVTGKLEDHYPQSDGGCTVKIYHAERCVRCGQVIRGDLICTYIYVKCPH